MRRPKPTISKMVSHFAASDSSILAHIVLPRIAIFHLLQKLKQFLVISKMFIFEVNFAVSSRRNDNNFVFNVLINRAQKSNSSILSWENTRKADVEAKLKKYEESLEKKRAGYAEKMKNKAAQIHKEAEEKRAHVEAKRREEVLKAEEVAAEHRSAGTTPKKVLLGCFNA